MRVPTRSTSPTRRARKSTELVRRHSRRPTRHRQPFLGYSPKDARLSPPPKEKRPLPHWQRRPHQPSATPSGVRVQKIKSLFQNTFGALKSS